MTDHDKNYDDTLILIKDVETDSGSWTYLSIDAGTPPTTETIASLGHEPNGYFWDGVVRRLVELNRTPQVALSLPGEAGRISRHWLSL